MNIEWYGLGVSEKWNKGVCPVILWAGLRRCVSSLALCVHSEIPHFKQVIIMATNCERCGTRSSEVKSGTGISELATKITLKLTEPSDLCRDILKVV